ncbi:GAF domain-containing protein [Hymenobacter taeanensis]|uniref:GAF domain-containing protein n=1 Tax=Hymenobacter taeanensis TaxID=2735321 RepID=A0A6M6BHL6_9BACT|nr:MULTISPECIES: GAF domain-containing protein [Hymenobacter]QJX46763.1 GAF domain-containing protein [Hymenobacter taeanensis]UOQ80631.1 GAF domain-containing protein [Hymenobacter sp. 5414T-23]
MPLPNALLPLNEADRLAALRPYQVRGTAPFFEEFIRVAAKLFGVPIAVISLVEADTVWFKAETGLEGPTEVPRSNSLCSVAILQQETTVFEAWQPHLCTLVNTDAVLQMGLAFYAGHPLRNATGEAIGALAIIDRQPRTFSEEERAVLATLAAVAMRLLELQVVLEGATLPVPALWPDIYISIAESLTRLDTLTALAEWEESPDTVSAQAYRCSRYEEMASVAADMQRQIRTAIARFGEQRK